MRFKPFGGIGDELMCTAVVREYKRRFPNEEITLVDHARKEIWDGNPWIRWGTTINGKQYQPDTYSFPQGGSAHGFAKQLGFELVDDTPEIWLTAEEYAKDFGVLNFSKTIAIDIEAKWASRQWEPGNFVKVAEALRADGWCVIEVGHRNDGSTVEVLGTKLPSSYSFLNKLKLRENCALLSQVDLFLGNDSGSFHMAAAVGTPQVALFGPIKWFARAYWNTTSVYAYSDCAPACNIKCSRQERGAYGPVKHCLDEIHPDRVVEAVRVAYNRFVVPGLRMRRPVAGRIQKPMNTILLDSKV